MIRKSYLRVYLPAGTSDADRLPEVVVDVRRPFETGLGITTEPPGNDAYVTSWQGERYVCPRTPRVRMLEGLLALRAASSRLGSAPLVPIDDAEAARLQLEHLRRDELGTSHILTSAWHVPIRWFVPFSPADRRLVGDPIRITYRCSARSALDRLDEATAILQAAGMPDGVVGEVCELRRWLSGFTRAAMLELDYGDVAGAFQPAELALDESVADLWESLAALGDGDWDTAGDRYDTLVRRWALPMSVSQSN